MLGQKDRGPSTRAALAQDDRRSQNRVPMRTTKERIRSALSEPSPALFAGEGVGEGLSRCSARKIGVLRLAQRSLRMTEERIRSALSEPSPALFAGEGVGEGLSRCSARKIGVLRLAQRSLRMTEEVRTAYR